MLLVEQKYKLKEKQDEVKNGKCYSQFQIDEPSASGRIKIAN